MKNNLRIRNLRFRFVSLKVQGLMKQETETSESCQIPIPE